MVQQRKGEVFDERRETCLCVCVFSPSINTEHMPGSDQQAIHESQKELQLNNWVSKLLAGQGYLTKRNGRLFLSQLRELTNENRGKAAGT